MVTLSVLSCGDNIKAPESIGISVSGLVGSGLVLNNNGETLAIDADGMYEFLTPVAVGASYDVTVAQQPGSPTQLCTVANGSGTVEQNVPIEDVTVTCTTQAFTIGGTVSGLTGTGLVLQNNGGDDLAVSANGSFTFAKPVASGAPFTVTVKTQPTTPTQTCTVSGASGTVGSGNVTTVVVDCEVDRFTVGGTISGLAGTVVLQNNGGDDITVTSNGAFAFPTTVASGTTYSVTVLTQPATPSQTCVVTNGTGTVGSADVTSVTVTCTTNTYSISGTVTGLAGAGLVLQNNGGDDLPIAADGTFTFAAAVASGMPYAVTVLAQPSSPTQVCTVTNGSGTVGGGPVTNVTVTCVTSTFTIGGSVTGLAGSGLVLQNNVGDDLPINADGTFTFTTPIESGATYAVTVLAQPSSPTQMCSVTNGSGTVDAGPVTNVTVTCVTSTFTIGGTVTGLAGTGLVLQNNAGNDLPIGADGTFTFTTPIASGATYAVTVLAQPSSPLQMCMVANGSGTVGGGPVTNVTVTCMTTTFTISGTVTGLGMAKTVVLRNNGGNDLTVSANGTFTFTAPVPSGQPYAVTVATQPQSQKCTVTNGTGTVTTANITTVSVTCVNGIDAFGEFRPALMCGNFVNNGNNTQQWCFTLKGQVRCLGAWANDGACTNTPNGIRINTSSTIAWPLRFNPNTNSCLNYNPNPAFVQNLANALGYSSYTIHRAQTGNSCDLSWIDGNGNYVMQPGSGDTSLAEIYDISFF